MCSRHASIRLLLFLFSCVHSAQYIVVGVWIDPPCAGKSQWQCACGCLDLVPRRPHVASEARGKRPQMKSLEPQAAPSPSSSSRGKKEPADWLQYCHA